MADSDTESIWLLFGPLNSLLYGAVGYTLWLFFIGDDDDASGSEKEDTDRPLGL